MSKGKKYTYVEPADYFPKELRKKYGLGEYNKEVIEEIRREFGLPDDFDPDTVGVSKKKDKGRKKKW